MDTRQQPNANTYIYVCVYFRKTGQLISIQTDPFIGQCYRTPHAHTGNILCLCVAFHNEGKFQRDDKQMNVVCVQKANTGHFAIGWNRKLGFRCQSLMSLIM